MQAVILAAGKSERFYPFSNYSHKSMVKLLGKSILSHTLESLAKTDVKKVVIVTKKGSDVGKIIGNGKKYGLTIDYVVQEEPTGMGDALLAAKDILEDQFFLLSPHHMDIEEFAKDMVSKKSKDNIVVLVKKDIDVSKYGVVELEGNSVISLTEKPENTQGEKHRLISIYLLDKSFVNALSQIPSSQYHFETALSEYALRNKVKAVETPKSALTYKYSWDLFNIKDYLLTKIKKYISQKAIISASSVIEGDVYVEDNVKIMEGAVIKGPCYLGKNVVVGNNAIVRDGVAAEENSVIGAQMEIKNTLLMDFATTHSGFIGDSIIGKNTKIAGAVCTANARLDRKEIQIEVKGKKTGTGKNHLGVIIGENVNVGVRVTFMPGSMVGNFVVVGPSTTVMENLADNTLYYTKFETVKKSTNE